MKIKFGEGEVYLREHCPLRLSEARGMVVRCTSGVLWMTVTGEAGDIVLAAGESHRVRVAGRVVIESIGSDARVRFEPGTGERIARAAGAMISSMRRLAGMHRAAKHLTA